MTSRPNILYVEMSFLIKKEIINNLVHKIKFYSKDLPGIRVKVKGWEVFPIGIRDVEEANVRMPSRNLSTWDFFKRYAEELWAYLQ